MIAILFLKFTQVSIKYNKTNQKLEQIIFPKYFFKTLSEQNIESVHKQSKSTNDRRHTMHKIIQTRKRQLQELRHTSRLQDILTEYDQQNYFLNKQVKQLLDENLQLKYACNSSAKFSCQNSCRKQEDSSRYYNTEKQSYKELVSKFKSDKKNDRVTDNFMGRRKSRYQYIFDEPPLMGNTNSNSGKVKEQTNKYESSHKRDRNVSQFTATFQECSNDKNPQASFNQIKFKKQNESRISQKQKSLSKSRNNSRSGSKKKLQVVSNSRLYQDNKQSFNDLKNSKTQKFNPQKTAEKTVTKDPYLQDSNISENYLENGLSRSKALQQSKQPILLKQAFTMHENDKKDFGITLGQSFSSKMVPQSKAVQHNQSDNSLLPLSLGGSRTKLSNKKSRISNTRSKMRQQETEQIYRTQTKSKRNHSLNPSPKIQNIRTIINRSNAFMKTQSEQLSNGKFNRVSTNKKTFIKVVSTSASKKKLSTIKSIDKIT